MSGIHGTSEFNNAFTKLLRLAKSRGRNKLRASVRDVAKIMRRAVRESAGIHGGCGEPLGPDDVSALNMVGIKERDFDDTGGGCHYYADRRILARWNRDEDTYGDKDEFYTKAEKKRIARIADSILPKALRANLRDQIAFTLFPLELDEAEEMILDDLGIDIDDDLI